MQYDFNLSANGSMKLDIAGKFFKYKSGTGMIRVRTSRGGYVDLLPGQGVWNVDYTDLIVTDKSGAANAGIILAGAFDFHDDRIAGTVDVVDGGKARTRADGAFFAYGAQGITVTNNHPYIELWNPAGSGKNVYVKTVIFSSVNAGFIGITPATASVGALLRNAKNKRYSGADGVTQVRGIEQVASLGAFNYTGAYMPANQSIMLRLEEPLMIEPGFGIAAGGSDAAIGGQITAAFELNEEQI